MRLQERALLKLIIALSLLHLGLFLALRQTPGQESKPRMLSNLYESSTVR